jgi:UDP-N-acetyl-D-galactosamine dehydrogenase
MTEKIAVIGLGYVGLPVAVAMGKYFDGVIGFDINDNRIRELQNGFDKTNEVSAEDLSATKINYTSNINDLKQSQFFIVTVPTPIDDNRQPDLTPVRKACETVGQVLLQGSVVVFESTVYPGVTEEICGPLLEKISGLKCGVDFKLGYSPERINPGDKVHRLETITKIVSAQDADSLARVKHVYGAVIKAGLYEAQSIKVAEAAKVIENTQRDINIALMNELSLIFDKLNIRTKDVLDAAGTKWNFLKFSPGLVGGHCIGVDPYYLTSKAEAHGYSPLMILSGRRINDSMGKYVAEKTVKLMIGQDKRIRDARVGILGLTFKENVPDIRNSRVPDIYRELLTYGIQPIVHDPYADASETWHEYAIALNSLSEFKNLDALILAVPHKFYADMGIDALKAMTTQKSVLIDVKSMSSPADFSDDQIVYWSL